MVHKQAWSNENYRYVWDVLGRREAFGVWFSLWKFYEGLDTTLKVYNEWLSSYFMEEAQEEEGERSWQLGILRGNLHLSDAD
jgi:hypothetical protein